MLYGDEIVDYNYNNINTNISTMEMEIIMKIQIIIKEYDNADDLESLQKIKPLAVGTSFRFVTIDHVFLYS